MANKLYILFLYLSLAALLAGCGDSSFDGPDQPVPGAPGTLTIRFSSSKATRSPESDKAEDLIGDLTVALYVDGAAENVPPVVVKSFPSLNADKETSVTMYLSNDIVERLFTTPGNTKCRIFAVANLPEGAPVPENPTISDLKAIAVTSSFKTVALQPSFVMAGGGSVNYVPSATGALGTASGSCTVARAAAKISLNVKLPQNIKVVNAEGVEETWTPVTGEGNIIAYINNGVESAVVYPVNPDATPWKPSGENAADAYYNSDPTKANTFRTFLPNGTVTEKETEYVTNPDGSVTANQIDVTYAIFGMNVPFYTYPNAWSVNNYEDTSQTTLTLIVRWRRGNESTWTNYYYQVPVTPTDIFQIDSNHSYTVNLKVGMLGSLVPDRPLEVEGTYQVMNWSTETVNVDINDYRYLVVNPNDISVQNEAEVLVPFYSSHELGELTDNITMTFQRFNFYNDGNGEVVDITVPQSKLDASVSNGEKMVSYEIVNMPGTNQKAIKLNHSLEIWTPVNNNSTNITNNNTVNLTGYAPGTNPSTVVNNINHFNKPANPETPYSSYVFKIHIEHKDNPSFFADITITQYPGMYIEAKRNPGTGASNHNAGGNVFVNNGSLNPNDNVNLGSITTNMGGSSDNQNPNMYVITISQLDESSEYYIGDPRTQYTNNTLTGNADLTTPTADGADAGNWCALAPFLYGTGNNGGDTRRLKYYYPTVESQEDEYKMRIAPKFRIASSYGKTTILSRQNARRRIATYQELNCPAGRWRLPTYGELQFIISLSSPGKIPVLFAKGSNYWTAQGRCKVNEDGSIELLTSNGDAYVRGVYDEWYWEDYPEYVITPTNGRYTYTLGDMPKIIN